MSYDDDYYLDASEAYYPPRASTLRTVRVSKTSPAIFDQSSVWVDSSGKIWAITDLEIDHLEHLLSWMNRNEGLHQDRYDAYRRKLDLPTKPISATPLHRALRREQKRRTILPASADVAIMALNTVLQRTMRRGDRKETLEIARETMRELYLKGFEVKKQGK